MINRAVGAPAKGTEIKVGKLIEDEGEKSLEVYMRRPYRKPTQVDRKKILRPTGEG